MDRSCVCRRCLQCPIRWDTARITLSWSKWIESIRKDVECTFGRLKARFRCLRIPSLFQGPDSNKVANQFRACCALYNALHDIDERGAQHRYEEVLRAAQAQPGYPNAKRQLFRPELDDDEYMAEDQFTKAELEKLRKAHGLHVRQRHQERVDAVEFHIQQGFDASHVGTAPNSFDPETGELIDETAEIEVEATWAQLRRKLSVHYALAVAMDQVTWVF